MTTGPCVVLVKKNEFAEYTALQYYLMDSFKIYNKKNLADFSQTASK